MDVYSNALIAADKTLRERPALMRRFVRATRHGVAWAAENIDGAVEAFAKHNPTASRDVAREDWTGAVDHLLTPTARKMGPGCMTREKMEATRDLITTSGKLPVKVAVEDLYTNDFLPKIPPK